MIRILFLALLASALPAHAADRCTDMAAMYQLALTMRDAGLDERTTLTYLGATQFSQAERQLAVQRVQRNGELGYLSARTLYRHIYLACKAA